MLSEDLQIYKDLFLLCKTLLRYQQQISKTVRYGEYAVAVQLACSALDMVYVANRDINMRERNIDEILRLIGGVRSRVRLFGELELLNVRQATNLMVLVDKVAKQSIGWRNASIRNNRQSHGAAT